jgi:hypothetical protein
VKIDDVHHTRWYALKQSSRPRAATVADFQHDRVLRYINAFGKHPPVGSADTPFLMPPSRTLPKFPLGCSETRAHPPKSPANAFPFSKKYRTQQVLHICYAIDMQQRLTLESQLVLTRKPVRDRSLSVTGAIAWSQRRYRRAQSEQPRSAMLAAHEAIDLVVMFRGSDRARANSGKCRQLYSSRAGIVGARDARPEAMDDGPRGDP